MERTSKLARLALVSKYYPVANYSYPRSEGVRTPYNSRRSSNDSEDKRTSLGSRASASASPLLSPPSLIDDRTDSEASADDDDFRYHAHGDELWDSFLESGLHIHSSLESKAVAMASVAAPPDCVPLMVPEKDYPALIPSPQQVRRRPLPQGPLPQGPLPQGPLPQGCSWPLSDSPARRPSPTYSAFPKIVPMPSGRCSRQSSSSQLSSACSMDAPCHPQHAPPLPPRPAASHYRSASPHPRVFSPASFMIFERPTSSHGSRPSTPLDYHYPPPSPPPTAPLPALPPLSSRSPHSPLATPRSSNLVHLEPALAQSRPPHKLTTQLRPKPPPEPLPISVFEYDTDSDCDDDGNEGSSMGSPTLSFFRFHRRSQSPNTTEGILARRRRSSSKIPVQQSFVDAATVAKDRRRRKRTNTVDSLPLVAKQADVLSRMLGRRSR